MGWSVEPGYRAYLLRLRCMSDTGPAWRASLEEVATGERRTFGSLNEMVSYLRTEIAESGRKPAAPPPEK